MIFSNQRPDFNQTVTFAPKDVGLVIVNIGHTYTWVLSQGDFTKHNIANTPLAAIKEDCIFLLNSQVQRTTGPNGKVLCTMPLGYFIIKGLLPLVNKQTQESFLGYGLP